MKFKDSKLHKVLISIKYKLITIYRYQIDLKKIEARLQLRKRLFLLWWYDAPKYQRDVEKGNFFLRRGTMYQVGQPFKIQDAHTKKIRTRYIDNLFFNFKTNEVNHKFSDKPIKGFSEPFLKPKDSESK